MGGVTAPSEDSENTAEERDYQALTPIVFGRFTLPFFAGRKVRTNRGQRFRSPVNVEPLCSNVRLVAEPFATLNV